jgi:hypothetical protein
MVSVSYFLALVQNVYLFVSNIDCIGVFTFAKSFTEERGCNLPSENGISSMTLKYSRSHCRFECTIQGPMLWFTKFFAKKGKQYGNFDSYYCYLGWKKSYLALCIKICKNFRKFQKFPKISKISENFKNFRKSAKIAKKSQKSPKIVIITLTSGRLCKMWLHPVELSGC